MRKSSAATNIDPLVKQRVLGGDPETAHNDNWREMQHVHPALSQAVLQRSLQVQEAGISPADAFLQGFAAHVAIEALTRDLQSPDKLVDALLADIQRSSPE